MMFAKYDDKFQFYDSPIKRHVRSLRGDGLYGFNSMIVRLKVRPYCLKKVVFKRFNSMIVRLKEQKSLIETLASVTVSIL